MLNQFREMWTYIQVPVVTHTLRIEDYDKFCRTTGTSIDRVAAPLHASSKRPIV
jgi:hypothetical protein